MKRNTSTLRKATALALILAVIPATTVWAASPPAPTYGVADVDGNPGEWNLAEDFFSDMHRAGDPLKPLEAKAYVRYDCVTQTVYVLVLAQPGIPALMGPGTAWVAINTQSNKVVVDSSPDDGTPPDFHWIGQGYDGDSTHAQGYEASFTLAPGSYEIIIHVNVFDGGSAQTAGTPGFPSDGPPLLLVCTDYGDLPSTYNVVTNPLGGYHTIGNLYLGVRIDGETDGQPNPSALGDDFGNAPDDEDGVSPTPGFVWSGNNGGRLNIIVTGGPGCLSGWIDWSRDFDFLDAGENIVNNVLLPSGQSQVSFPIPVGTVFDGSTEYFARFRLYAPVNGSCEGVTPSLTGAATNGEVEDYVFTPGTPTAVVITTLRARAGANAMPLALAAGGVFLLVGLAVVFRRQR